MHQNISEMTDCGQLQAEFDRAWTNHESAEPGSDIAMAATAYMETADERLREIGCY